MKRPLHTLYEYCALYLGLGLLGLLCLLWIPVATILYFVLPRRHGGMAGRYAVMSGFFIFIRFLSSMGACRFDLSALDALRGQSPMIIAPNHPCLLDAVMVISRLPNVACIMKAGLIDNIFLGAGARLARYIRNDSTVKMVVEAVDSLQEGNHLLIFPEGTRTTRLPVNPFMGSIGFIARRAGVPVQTVFIETDSAYLSKGWPLFRKPSMPITYRIRLGRRFEPENNVKTFMMELERYFTDELVMRAPMPELPPAA
jgi:1-acyl-sn-glycerol-3-phosphate acyltransferase